MASFFRRLLQALLSRPAGLLARPAAAREPLHEAPGTPVRATAPLELRPPVQPFRHPRRHNAGAGQGSRVRPNAVRFLAWIQQGIADGSLPWNEANALVHFVPQGMLIVSPRAFQQFALAHPEAIEPDSRALLEPWRVVQRDFQRSGYPMSGERGNYFRYYQFSSSGRRLVAQLVPDPGRFFDPVPHPNPRLRPIQMPAGH